MGVARVHLLDAHLMDIVVSDVIESGGTKVTRRLRASIR